MRGRLRVLGAAILWSTGGAISKALDLDALTIAFYRGLFAGLALLPFAPRRTWVFRPALFPLGVAFAAMVGFFLGAVKTTTSANAIFLQCSAVLWVVPLSAIFLGERPDRRAGVSIAIAVVGIALIVGWGYDGRPGEWRGILLGLGAGIVTACVSVSLRGLRDLGPIWLSAILNLLGTAALGIWASVGGQGIVMPDAGQILVLIAFGVVQMAIPYALFARGLREIGAPEAGLIGLVEPVLNPIWVILFVHEWPAGATIVGGLFLLAGLAYRYWPSSERLKTPERIDQSR